MFRVVYRQSHKDSVRRQQRKNTTAMYFTNHFENSEKIHRTAQLIQILKYFFLINCTYSDKFS